MADSAVPITSGSGTNIDTRTEGTNGHHRQVIVVGDPSTNAGVAPVDATAGLKVNLGADNDVTVTGTVAVTQSGAWAVTVSTAAVTNAGTFAVQEDGAALTALQAIKTAVELIDDAVAAEGAALGKGILIQADDGTDRQNLQIDDTSKGLKVELWGAGQSAGAAVQPTQADATGNGTNGLVTTGLLYGFNGTSWDRLRSNATTMKLQVEADISAGSNLIGDVGLQPRAANGLTTKMCSSADSSTALTNSAQAIKASAGLLYGYYIYNPNSTAQFVQIYNVASGSVTVGTTAPLIMLTIPPESAANLMLPIGITFSTAISTAATSTAGGNGAPTSSLDAVFWYN